MPETLEEARQQLAGLRQQQASLNPELYRQLALYLQVLRDGLLQAVRQACFHLATETHADRYLAMPPEQRRRLHQRLEALVQRAGSLLTVEQLAELAAQLARERLALLQRAMAAPAEDPPGSIQLSLQPPLRGDGGPSLPTRRHGPEDDPQDEPDAGGISTVRQDLLGLLQAAVERFDGEAEPGPMPPWDRGRLPHDPGALLVWLDGFERALERRLRNLSHALNVELMRLGLSSALLPLALLESALQGRLELQASLPNLVSLPMAGGEAQALLLRCSDLELALPALRTCRGRWRAHLADVRKMAERGRRLQRRVQVLEAQQLWLTDINSPAP